LSKIGESEECEIVPPRPFDKRKNPEDLAVDQEVEPVEDFDALLGDFWPENESADEFVTALRRWRHNESPEA
jgi:hypothetical protein